MSHSPIRPDPSKASEPIGSSGAAPKAPTSQSRFETQMQNAPTKQPPGTSAPSPAELTKMASSQREPSINSLAAQVSTSQEGYQTLRNQLKTQNLSLKSSQQRLIGNKLSDASGHLRAANEKLGGNPAPQAEREAGTGPVGRFLGLIGDGENQLQAVQQQLANISKSGTQMRPADLLLVQIKMGQAQQEIEYSSMLLSKVIESIKTMLNIQL